VIKNQELVGASWSFITGPYIRRGIINGIISATIAIAALSTLIWLALKSMPELEVIHDPSSLIAIGLGLLMLGAFIGGLSTWWVVNKFLKMRLEDLY
jgi:cell division transport system permease protein